MRKRRERTLKSFVELGRRLESFGTDDQTQQVIDSATVENNWFSRSEIEYAVRAIREKMLDQESLYEWTKELSYPKTVVKVGIIMAGNLPLVGFFDLLSVLVFGGEAHVKPSSKESVLIGYMIAQLQNIYPEIAVKKLHTESIDAIIATGSDNTNRYFRSAYGNIPSIFRGNRSSLAILTGDETDRQLKALSTDIFLYSGLGCRNVSRLLVPPEYDFSPLIKLFSEVGSPNAGYKNNYLQNRALSVMQSKVSLDGEFFTLTETDDFPVAISEIGYSRYASIEELRRMVADVEQQTQCVVASTQVGQMLSGAVVQFGEAQRPGLEDYPDGVDILSFLETLAHTEENRNAGGKTVEQNE